MATIIQHESLMSQKPFEVPWAVSSRVAPSEFMEPREALGYTIPEVYLEPNMILRLGQRRRSGWMDVGGLFTTPNCLGPVSSVGLGASAAPQTATAVLPIYESMYETRRLMAHTVVGITTIAAHIQQLQDFTQTIKASKAQLPAVLQTAVIDTLQRTLQTEMREVVSPAAEEYAKSLGAYGSLILTKKLIWETIPNLRHLSIDRQEDLDEGGYPVVRFTITTPDPVERVLEQDDQLQRAFCRRIPPRHQPYFAITYQSGT